MSEEIEEHREFTELEPLEEVGQATSAPAAKSGPGEKRALEQAPLLLRKASKILIVGALFPWLVALKSAGPIPWVTLFAAKGVALLAFYIFHEGYKATHGGKTEGFIAKLADAHHVIVPAVAGVIALLAFLIVFGVVPGLPADGMASPAAAGEIATLLLAAATFSHIFGYEHGGKFNPIFPLMFLGPGIAGLLSVFGAAGALAGGEKQLAVIGLVGNILVAMGGCMAIYVMFVAMKQAKVEGDQKRAASREARKAARSGGRAPRSSS